jgi:glycosyltransferase involved in cell wall biosynthesis
MFTLGQGSADLSISTQVKVAVLMATCNGADHLLEQIQSLIEQSHSRWELCVSDDGSSDQTLAILDVIASTTLLGRMRIFFGPRQGFARNFLSLARRSEIQADYFAFCDQDDLWHKDKLARGLATLQQVPANVPALYCSRTRSIDGNGGHLGFSPLFTKSPCFANALVQSIAGGNTMIFNSAARDLLAKTPDNITIVSHDWWAYLLVSGCGGQVFYDAEATLDYRQHAGNLMGTNVSLSGRLLRLKKLINGVFREWNTTNVVALNFYQTELTAENNKILKSFAKGRDGSILPRLRCIKETGVFRQTLVGHLGLWMAAIFKKV